MAERQIYGFKYQTEFCEKNNLKEVDGYTDKFDAVDKKGLFYQIKTYKNKGELMMADPFRYIENKKDFVLVIANRDNDDKILSERKFLIKNEVLQNFFDREDFKFRVHYCQQLLKSVSNEEKDDEYFTEHMKIEKEARKYSIINIQAKRDHKSQKRVQWSIPNRNINTFLSIFKELK